MQKITVIPAKPRTIGTQALYREILKRVAGYARVSTSKEEQENSYERQLEYYTTYIKSRADWQFVDVYTDEGTPYGGNPKSPQMPIVSGFVGF